MCVCVCVCVLVCVCVFVCVCVCVFVCVCAVGLLRVACRINSIQVVIIIMSVFLERFSM